MVIQKEVLAVMIVTALAVPAHAIDFGGVVKGLSKQKTRSGASQPTTKSAPKNEEIPAPAASEAAEPAKASPTPVPSAVNDAGEIVVPKFPTTISAGATPQGKSLSRDLKGSVNVKSRCAKDDENRWKQYISGLRQRANALKEPDRKDMNSFIDGIEAWAAHQFVGIPGYGTYDVMKARLAANLKAIDAVPTTTPKTASEIKDALEKLEAYRRAFDDIKTAFNEVPKEYACLQHGGDWVGAWNKIMYKKKDVEKPILAAGAPIKTAVENWQKIKKDLPDFSKPMQTSLQQSASLGLRINRNMTYINYMQQLKKKGFYELAAAYGGEGGEEYANLGKEVDEALAKYTPELEKMIKAQRPQKAHKHAEYGKLGSDLIKQKIRPWLLYGDFLEGDVYGMGKVDRQEYDDFGKPFQLKGRFFSYYWLTDAKYARKVHDEYRRVIPVNERDPLELPSLFNTEANDYPEFPELPTLKSSDICYAYSNVFYIYDQSKSKKFQTKQWFNKSIMNRGPFLCSKKGEKGEILPKDMKND